MPANIYYRPVRNDGTVLPAGSPSSCWETLQRAFDGGDTITLGSDDRPKLEGIRAASSAQDEFWGEVLEAIDKHGEIELFRVF